MPTLESSLRSASKIKFDNDTVKEVHEVLVSRHKANEMLQAACDSNDKDELVKALKLSMDNGLFGTRLSNEAERRLTGLQISLDRRRDQAKAKELREKLKNAMSMGAISSLPRIDPEKLNIKKKNPKQPVPLMSLVRTPFIELDQLAPKRMSFLTGDQSQTSSQLLATSSKAAELFLKGCKILCERPAEEPEGIPILELALQKANIEGDLGPVIERVGRAHACFQAAQRTASAAYGVLDVTTTRNLGMWLYATRESHLAVPAIFRKLCDARRDIVAATGELEAHRTKYKRNHDDHLLQAKEEEGRARSLLAHSKQRFAALGVGMSAEDAKVWETTLLAGRLERLGHFLFKPKAELENFNLSIARGGVAKGLHLIQELGRLDPAVPDPIVALLELVLELMDHPITKRVFSPNTTLDVGSNAWSKDWSAASETGLSSVFSTDGRPSGASLGGRGRRTEAVDAVSAAAKSPRELPPLGQSQSAPTLTAAPSEAPAATPAAAPAPSAPPPPPISPTAMPLSPGGGPRSPGGSIVHMQDGGDGPRINISVPARSQFLILVDESLEGMTGSGRALEAELRKLSIEMEMHLDAGKQRGLEMDPSGMIASLMKGVQEWTERHFERERQREVARDIAVKEKIAKKRAAALYEHTPLDRAGAESVMEKVRAALSKDMKRTLDFFRACDEDYSGAVDRKEFRKAIDKIVPGVTKGVCAALFDMIDKDKSDTIEYDEINAQLRQREDMRPISRGRVMMARPSRNVRIEKYKRQLSKA